MRIGIVLSQTPGYSETFFTSKIKGLQARGYKVQLFVQKRSAAFNLCEVQLAPKVLSFLPLQIIKMLWVYVGLVPNLTRVKRFIKLERANSASWGSVFKSIYLNAHILNANLDWVHFGFATQALGSEYVAKAIGAKMAVSFRGFDLNVYPLKSPDCYHTLWETVDKVHSISEYLYKKAIGLGLSEKVPHRIITPAIAINYLPKPSETFTNILQITTIARLNWIKGLDTAIAAMGLLKKEGFEFQYHIIGDGNTKDFERYSFQVYEEDLTNLVIFHGKLSHDATLERLNATEIYLQPSINEGFCNAVLEAQALGKLAIASNVGALPENIIDRKTGWLFPVSDAKALAETIKKVTQLSMEEKEKISKKAKQRAQTHFTIEQQQQKFVSFYTEKL